MSPDAAFPEVLRQCLAGIVELSDSQVAALQKHYELLLRWNRVLNLTTITGLEEAVERHYGESLFLGSRLPMGQGLRVVDIGAGPGFPGFPVSVMRPDISLTLVESHQRKAVFLKEAARGLRNCRVLAVRAEDVVEQFDWAISRAVSYQDLGKSIPRLAAEVALLTGSEEPPPEWGLVWEPPIALPWGKGRFLRMTKKACFT